MSRAEGAGMQNKLIAMLSSLLVTACVTGSEEGQRGTGGKGDGLDGVVLGPNDVSVLFPFSSRWPSPSQGFERLVPLERYLSQTVFAQVKAAADASQHNHTPPERMSSVGGSWPLTLEAPRGNLTMAGGSLVNYRIVGFRVDPCAAPPAHVVPLVADGRTYDDAAERTIVREQCVAELRLVAQPFRGYLPASSAAVSDIGMHLFFRFDSTEVRDDMLNALGDLKRASTVSTDGALAIHPGLAADQNGELTAAMTAFLDEFTARGALRQIALMGQATPPPQALGRARPDIWGFFVGEVNGEEFRVLEMQQSWAVGRSPEVPGPDTYQVTNFLTNELFIPGPRFSFTTADINDDDTTRVTVRKVDCVSCHLTARTVDIQLPSNLRMFGYHEMGVASIAQRTRNESAAIARYINEL
jgi:hypothetical protein